MNKYYVIVLWCIFYHFLASASENCCWNVNNNNFYFAADYLFWKAEEDQLQYAVNIPGGFNDNFLEANQIIVVNQKFKANSGVRLTGGYSWCDDWNVQFSWTHFNKCSLATIEGVPNSIIAIAIFQLIDNPIGSAASSKWCLKFDTFDLDLAKEWCFCDSFLGRLFFGLKGARIKQQQDIDYLGLANDFDAHVTIHNNFSAVGPRAGIDARYNFWCNLNLVGTVAGALLYGKFDVNAQNFVSNDTQEFSPTIIDKRNRLRPTVQMLLGLSWQYELCNMTSLELMAAYEVQYWWNQWQTLIGLSSVVPHWTPGDLTTQGLTLRFGIHF